ncbi:MAG: Fe-S cluster assembly protein SufD [Betaproteobacteria bacterium]|nr:Fe-S cluster assembly protein SufD [Betaproteobacteria bacterium]
MIALAAYRDALSRIEAPPGLAALRRTHLRKFLQAGLPDRQHEDWRYTSLAHLEHMPLHAPLAPTPALLALEAYPGELRAWLDDRPVQQDVPPSAVLGALADVIGAGALPAFGSLAPDSALARLNAALWREGASLRVPAGERLARPVFLRFAAAAADAMLHPRVFVHLAEGAEAILVEHFLGDPGIAYWQNPVTEIALEAGARLTHLRLIEEGPLATHTGLTAVRQERDSRYQALNLTLGGRVTRHELGVTLAGPGAEARLDGVFIADARNSAEQHVRVVHQAPHGTSRTLYRGLADGRGRGVFDARAEVQPHADGSDARQSSRNLLLSPQAEIDVKPQLVIHADDIQCSHGATVGSLDEDALFYLRSRGIDTAGARQLLLEAFVEEALGLLDAAGLRGWLMPRLLASLPRARTVEVRP